MVQNPANPERGVDCTAEADAAQLTLQSQDVHMQSQDVHVQSQDVQEEIPLEVSILEVTSQFK